MLEQELNKLKREELPNAPAFVSPAEFTKDNSDLSCSSSSDNEETSHSDSDDDYYLKLSADKSSDALDSEFDKEISPEKFNNTMQAFKNNKL